MSSENIPLVLVVDDEADIRELISITLARMNIKCVTAENIKQARELLTRNNYFLCLADMRLPDGQGIELVEEIQHKYPNLPVAIITAYGNVEGAVNTLKAGAFDYVSKPVDLQILRRLVDTAFRMTKLSHENDSQEKILLGNSKVMCELRDKIKKLARSQAPVYINGESGSGKELVARMIHTLGPRSSEPFVPVNCGAIPAELMESEFFGHKKGSFTGAHTDKQGLFQAADGGTLFLDEIADLPLAMQVKLLRAIQERSIRPLGSNKEVSIDVRLLSASHVNLYDSVEKGKFRRDLFYRINVIEVGVAPLVERLEDLPQLAEHILSKIAAQQQMPKYELSDACLKALREYHFPGNVRELENILERAVALSDKQLIEVDGLHLPNSEYEPLHAKNQDTLKLDQFMESQEREAIVQSLVKHKWNRTQAARDLGISLRALRYRLKKLTIE